jgi:hypothetical protein
MTRFAPKQRAANLTAACSAPEKAAANVDRRFVAVLLAVATRSRGFARRNKPQPTWPHDVARSNKPQPTWPHDVARRNKPAANLAARHRVLQQPAANLATQSRTPRKPPASWSRRVRCREGVRQTLLRLVPRWNKSSQAFLQPVPAHESLPSGFRHEIALRTACVAPFLLATLHPIRSLQPFLNLNGARSIFWQGGLAASRRGAYFFLYSAA